MNDPEFQDLVKNKITHITGTVIAKYSNAQTDILVNTINLIDVRLETGGGDRNIWYGSPVENWEVIKPYDPENE
jgi:hypothetical protein